MSGWLRDLHTPRWLGSARTRWLGSARTQDEGDIAPAAHERPRPRPLAPAAMPTALQRHVAFFDRNGDGIISLRETYRGSRALGFGRALSGLLALVINGGLGWVTADPARPTLRIRVAGIHRGKHGSDTDIYDQHGRFVPTALEDTFARYDRDGDGALSLRELWQRARADRDVYDLVGQIASLAEFGLVYLIAADRGKISRDTFRAIYDGTLFYQVEARVAEARWRRARPSQRIRARARWLRGLLRPRLRLWARP